MTAPHLRRAPQQARGARRIEAILDAAEALLAEVGPDAMTTNAIAARAHTSIGSLYQFFPNKEAVLQALAGRYLERMRVMRTALLSPTAVSLDLTTWIDRITEALVETQLHNPGFKALFCEPLLWPEIAAADQELQQEIMQGIDALFAAWAPELATERRALYSEISVQVTKALLPLAWQAHDARRAEILAEIKRLLHAYLAPVFDRPR